jgi:uncharacterized protein
VSTPPGSASLVWHGETLHLLPGRAVHWPRAAALLIADPHFGKAAAFRAAGVPVPIGTTATDTERLSLLLMASAARRLIVLGDFFHAAAGRAPATMARLAAWRAQHAALEIVLVLGNHDVAAGPPPEEWRVRCVRGVHRGEPFGFVHDPADRPADALPCFAGHMHPVIALEEPSGARLRAPCFLFGRQSALLPAFGSFTGGGRVVPLAGERVFVVGDDEVVELPEPATARAPRSAGRRGSARRRDR